MTKDAMESLRNRILERGVPKCYIGDLPNLRVECVTIRPVDGYPSTLYFGMQETLEPLVEVLVRANTYELGQLWYNNVYQALSQYSDEEAGITNCTLVGSPGYLGKNTNGFGEWHMIAHLTLNSINN